MQSRFSAVSSGSSAVVPAAVLVMLLAATVRADVKGEPGNPAPPYLSAGSNWHSTAALDNGEGSVRTREHALALGLVRLQRAGATFDLGISYDYTHFALDGIDSRNRDVHRLQIPLEFSIESGERLWRGYIAPGIATSSNVFKDFLNRGGRDDLTLAGRIELTGPGSSSAWFAGIAYDQAFGGPHIYPVAGFESRPDDNLRIRIAFPDPAIRYRYSDRHAFAARVFPAGQRWRVVTDDFRSDFDLRREEWRLQLTWSVAVASFVTLELSAGQAFERRFVVTDRSGERIDSGLGSEAFIGIDLRFGAPPGAR